MGVWQPLKIGGGGFITGYSVSDDGATRVIRTDTYGDYRWDADADQWVQMLTWESMGPAIAVIGNHNPTYEVVVAPDDASRLYRWWKGDTYRSDDVGATWTVTAYPHALDAVHTDGNAFNLRTAGKNIAVHPTNADLVLAGGYIDGLLRTSNGGTGWTAIASVPRPSWKGYRVNGSHPAGSTVIAVDTGTAGISTSAVLYFTETGNTAHYVTGALGVGSGNITITPALSANIAGGQLVGSAGGVRVAFDPANAGVVYAASYGNGVYKSSDDGATFVSIGGPTTNQQLRVAVDGVAYVTTDPYAETSAVWKYTGSWTDISPGGDASSLACDPNNAARIVTGSGGFINTSLDRGATWVQTAGAYWGPNCLLGPTVPFSGQRRAATDDVPWLEWTQECIISGAAFEFDPVVANRVWMPSGIGVFYYDFASGSAAPTAQITWTSQSRGIEQLVVNNILSLPGGKPNVTCWDRPQFYVDDPDVYPSTHGPNALDAIVHGWNIDYVAGTPTTMAGLFNLYTKQHSGISTDGGQTWTTFASQPFGTGGNIAVSTALNMLVVPQANASPYYTTDGGANWTEITSAHIPGLPSGGAENGFGFSVFLNSKFGCADKVNANTFYLHNYGPAAALSIAGFYRSTDSGATWTKVFDGQLVVSASSANCKLLAVPDYAGHLFFAYGIGTEYGGFHRSTDGAATWTAIDNVTGVNACGFGAIAPDGDYPSVYISGWVGGTYGIWRGDGSEADWNANAATWTNLTEDTGGMPLGIFDYVKAVEGDADTWGKVYVGFAGTGAAYYSEDGEEPEPEEPSIAVTSLAAMREIADLDATLAEDGQDIVLYRVITSGSTQTRLAVDVRAFVRPYRQTPDEIAAGVVQDFWHLIMSPSEIIAADWPGSWTASPSEPIQTELDRRVPRSGDKVVFAGRARNVEFAAPFYIDNALCRIELWAKG